ATNSTAAAAATSKAAAICDRPSPSHGTPASHRRETVRRLDSEACIHASRPATAASVPPAPRTATSPAGSAPACVARAGEVTPMPEARPRRLDLLRSPERQRVISDRSSLIGPQLLHVMPQVVQQPPLLLPAAIAVLTLTGQIGIDADPQRFGRDRLHAAVDR